MCLRLFTLCIKCGWEWPEQGYINEGINVSNWTCHLYRLDIVGLSWETWRQQLCLTVINHSQSCTWLYTPQWASLRRPAWPAPACRPCPCPSAHGLLADSALLRKTWGRGWDVKQCLCVSMCVLECAFPRRGAGGNVTYEIRMQYKEKEGLKLN